MTDGMLIWTPRASSRTSAEELPFEDPDIQNTYELHPKFLGLRQEGDLELHPPKPDVAGNEGEEPKTDT